jgi:hypothetical protein
VTNQKANQLCLILRTVCVLILIHCRYLTNTKNAPEQHPADDLFDFISSNFSKTVSADLYFVATTTPEDAASDFLL